jgi:hypothetical protein
MIDENDLILEQGGRVGGQRVVACINPDCGRSTVSPETRSTPSGWFDLSIGVGDVVRNIGVSCSIECLEQTLPSLKEWYARTSGQESTRLNDEFDSA